MKKLLFTLFYVCILLSCNNKKNEYERNLSLFKQLIKDINTYFINPSQDSLKISDYYTKDFIFYSYPAGNKKGIKTNKNKYISELKQMKKRNMFLVEQSCFCAMV